MPTATNKTVKAQSSLMLIAIYEVNHFFKTDWPIILFEEFNYDTVMYLL